MPSVMVNDTVEGEISKSGRTSHIQDKKSTPITSDPAAANPTLFSLPAEIRNRIYRFALHRGRIVTVQASKRHRLPGILRASRQLRSEARQIFCEENEFFVKIVHGKLPGREHWIWHLGSGKKAEFHNVGSPTWSDFREWVDRYWHDQSMIQWHEISRDQESAVAQEEVLAMPFYMVDQMRKTNASMQVVSGLIDTVFDTLAYVVAVGDFFVHPDDIEMLQRRRSLFEPVDPVDTEGSEEAYHGGELDAWHSDC